jgi:hypothetical protein
MTDGREGGQSDGGRRPHPIYNWLSLTGLAIAACNATALVFFVLVGVVSRESGYVSLTLLPPLVGGMLGLCLALAGLIRERWRQKHGRHSTFLGTWVLDPLGFLRGVGLGVVTLGLMVATLGLLVAGAGSLALSNYSESNSFCGLTCHHVMGPEATAYEDSPHSRIACVECHVGPGGDSYLRSKIGGLGRLWAVATDSIERPIPTPIRDRRTSREMCESCHTPDRFIGYKTISHSYFLSGEESNPLRMLMLVKVGGGGAGGGAEAGGESDNGLLQGSGIHYHMLTTRTIEYGARDPKRQDIAWVRVTDRDGTVREYAKNGKLTDAERSSLEVRTMECVDCHSRPAHSFESPVKSVNAALAAGAISSEIPRVKEASVRALDGDYPTTAAAMEGIAESIREFYEEEDSEVLEEHSEAIEKSVQTLKGIYRRTIFPEMKAKWSTHPDNIGHRDFPGCFRCHNDEMVDNNGKTVFTDCTKCHAILAQGEKAIAASARIDTGQPFVHPEDFEVVDEFMECTECHSGGGSVYE